MAWPDPVWSGLFCSVLILSNLVQSDPVPGLSGGDLSSHGLPGSWPVEPLSRHVLIRFGLVLYPACLIPGLVLSGLTLFNPA